MARVVFGLSISCLLISAQVFAIRLGVFLPELDIWFSFSMILVAIVLGGGGIGFAISELIIARKQLVSGGLGIAIGVVGLTSFLFLPDRQTVMTPTYEAVVNIDRMAARFKELVSKKRTTRLSELIETTDWTPDRDCCASGKGSKGLCSYESSWSEWKGPTWEALGYPVEKEYGFQYRILVGKRKVSFQAKGDLECDGNVLYLERSARLLGGKLLFDRVIQKRGRSE